MTQSEYTLYLHHLCKIYNKDVKAEIEALYESNKATIQFFKAVDSEVCEALQNSAVDEYIIDDCIIEKINKHLASLKFLKEAIENHHTITFAIGYKEEFGKLASAIKNKMTLSQVNSAKDRWQKLVINNSIAKSQEEENARRRAEEERNRRLREHEMFIRRLKTFIKWGSVVIFILLVIVKCSSCAG